MYKQCLGEIGFGKIDFTFKYGIKQPAFLRKVFNYVQKNKYTRLYQRRQSLKYLSQQKNVYIDKGNSGIKHENKQYMINYERSDA